MMDKPALKKLAASIKVNGQQEEITLIEHEGEEKILDGRNRDAACRMAGVEPEFKDYQGDDPLGYVIEKNMERRHLTPGQLGKIAAKIASMTAGRPTKAPNGAVKKVSQVEAAKKVGVSRRTVQRAVAAEKPPAKKKPKEASSWSAEDLKGDGELMNAFVLIDTIYGHEDTKAIRLGHVGLKRPDVLYLSKMEPDKMRECQDLIMAHHWTPKEAFAFMNRMATEKSTVKDLIHWCLGTKGKFFTADFMGGGFTVTCKANRAITRKN